MLSEGALYLLYCSQNVILCVLFIPGKRQLYFSFQMMRSRFQMHLFEDKPLPFHFSVGPDGLDHARGRGGVVVEVVHVVIHVQRRHRHGALRQSFATRQSKKSI